MRVPLCSSVCLSQSPPFWSHTLFRMCTCISTCIYVHLTPVVAKPPMDSYMETWVPLCVCLIHPVSGPILWLKCVHASLHVYRSTWLLKCAAPPLHSYMKTWLLLYGTVYASQSPHFCFNNLFRMCTFISACIYVHPTAHVISTHYGLVTRVPRCPCVAVYVCPSQPTSGHTPCLECVHASVHVYMSTWLTMSVSPLLNSYIETWVPLCGIVCVPITLLLVTHLGWNVYMHQYMILCPPDCLCLLHSLCIVWWKAGCPCTAVCLCPSHLISVPPPWLECVHVSLYVFMSTSLSMSAPSTMDSYM